MTATAETGTPVMGTQPQPMKGAATRGVIVAVQPDTNSSRPPVRQPAEHASRPDSEPPM